MMAQGIEVLQAALNGKRVRLLRAGDGSKPGAWLDIALLRSCWDIRSLLDLEWEIEEPTMTFAEAIAAMDAGHVVQRQAGDGWLWRKCPDELFYECADPDEGGDNWGGGGLDYDDVHATDWRIVTDEPLLDRRPTRQEAQGYLVERGFAGGIIDVLWHWRPDMFRQEDA